MKTIAVTVSGIALVCAIGAGAQVASKMSSTTSTPKKSVGVVVVTAGTAPAASPTATISAFTSPAAPSTPLLAGAQPVGVKIKDPLPPLDLKNMKLWNYGGTWHASEWDYAMSATPWRFNNVKQAKSGDTAFTLNATGAPQLQGTGGTPANTRGLWEVEVTLPKLRAGMIVAPLWLYDQTSKDEIDFEFAGTNGLDVTMHSYVAGVHKQATTRLFAGIDMSNQRKRFGIKMDQKAGYVEMYVDGERVFIWSRSNMPFFVSKPMKPIIEMWSGKATDKNFTTWAGKWSGLTGTQSTVMTVHGYRYKTIP